jgi:hypothetical protein
MRQLLWTWGIAGERASGWGDVGSRVRRFGGCIAVAMVWICVQCSPALAMHPSESPNANEPEFQCNAANENGSVLLSDGEQWICKYDPVADDYFWEPLPTQFPGDGTAYRETRVTAPDGVTFRITSRIEWINHILYSGVDVFSRKPLTSPFVEPAGWVGVYARTWAWNGSAWSICREGPWVSTTSASDRVAHTFNLGTAPCGAQWYMTHAYIERWHPETTSWIIENSGAPVSTVNGTNLGAAVNGQVWDAPRGDHRKPPKTSRKRPKDKAPLASPPVVLTP